MARDSDRELLLRTSQRIAMAMDVDGVVTAYLEQVAARGRYVCTIVLYDVDAVGRRTRVVIWGAWTPDGGLTLRREERRPRPPDQLDPLLDAGQTVTISDVQTDPRAPAELRAFQAQAGRPALAMIPLLARQRRVGLVILSAPLVQAWSTADLHPYQLTATQLASAIDSRRQHQLLAERERQLAVLEERRRLAWELHDSVTQLIFSATLVAESIEPLWPAAPADAARRLARLMELNRAALAEMRALLVELRGADEAAPVGSEASVPNAGESVLIPSLARVRREGLPAALAAHIAGLGDGHLQVALTTDAYVAQPPAAEAALFRIAQEALTNVCKHAQARRVAITLATRDGATTLTVADDGVGFAPGQRGRAQRPATGHQHGFGLHTMRERAAALGGAIRVVSAPGRGTTVTATLPVPAAGGAR
jgi:signal transduction histidine kinase